MTLVKRKPSERYKHAAQNAMARLGDTDAIIDAVNDIQDGTSSFDTISEKTAGHGVIVDSVTLKDGGIIAPLVTDATTKDTGSIVTEGGIGVEKAIYAGTKITSGGQILGGVTTSGGTAATPGLGVLADMGIYGASGSELGFTTQGVFRGRISSSGLQVASPGITNTVIGYTNPATATFTAQRISATDTNGKIGYLTTEFVTAKATLAGASTSIAVNVPSGARVIAVQFAVPTAITSGDGATSWKAKFATGSTAVLTVTQPFTINTKVDVFYSETTMAATAVTTDVTTILIEPNANTFSGGVISAIVYYESLTSITT